MFLYFKEINIKSQFGYHNKNCNLLVSNDVLRLGCFSWLVKYVCSYIHDCMNHLWELCLQMPHMKVKEIYGMRSASVTVCWMWISMLQHKEVRAFTPWYNFLAFGSVYRKLSKRCFWASVTREKKDRLGD